MELPGVTGDWAVKDIVAHLTAWEGRPVAWLKAARDGTAVQPAPWDTSMSEQAINAWIYQTNHSRPLANVLAESRLVFERLVIGIEALSDQQLNERRDWLDGRSLIEAMAANTFEHYREHGAAIQTWLNQVARAESTTFSAVTR